MDKMFNSRWFVKVVSFFIALMLYTMVNMDSTVTNQPGVLPITNNSHTLEKVELNVYFNEEEFAITEAPEFVQVNLKGPQNLLTVLQITRPTYEVFVDLRNLEAGTHYLTVEHQGFPKELSVAIQPQTVKVTMEEKRTISLPVEIDLLNQSEVSEGYTVGIPIANPNSVEITAAESIIQQVSFVKGFIDVTGASQTINKTIPIKVYDRLGNELQLAINPPVVDVKVPITSPNKDVPLKLNRVGELQEGLSIRSIRAEPSEVTIFGPLSIIGEIEYIDTIDIDMALISENSTMEVEVPIPEGVEKVSPERVTVFIEVEKAEQIELEGVAVDIIGLPDRMEAIFVSPDNGRINVTIKGALSTIQRLRTDDIRAYIDLNQLSIGEHVVPLQINGPQNVTFDKSPKEVKVVISEVLSIEETSEEDTELETTT